MKMNKRFSYCGDCMNKDMCAKCYCGSHYESGGARLYDYYCEHEHDEDLEND